MRWVILNCLLLLACLGTAQDSLKTKAIAAIVQLDSVTIVATRQGFSVEDFIRLVQTDESLYTAFRNLRTTTYRFETSMSFSDKRQQTKATYESRNKQISDGHCRRMEVMNEDAGGDFYKGRKKKHRYYTYALYDRVFLTHGTVCEDTRQPGTSENEQGMERHISELKKLIFRPGERSNVPFIGRKTEIFSEDMMELYDLSIRSAEYNGMPAYVFSATVKDRYASKENKTVFKELTTYFAKGNFQVIARKYTLSQNTAAYMFDVTMQVDLARWNDKYIPVKVLYNGEWDIPTRKREIGMFEVFFADFQ